MPALDDDTLVDQLTLIGLVSRDQFREAKAEADDNSADAVLRSLMRKGWLTSWQLERLKKGDASSFFFGEYRALFHLAEGTFARVYRGEHSATGSPVAIKVLRHRFATAPEAVAAFHKEAEAGMRLRHENIVLITDSGQHDDRHFMVMEYVEGMNLREFLRLRVRLKGPEALPLMIGLAEGLKYSHEQGVTHRDLKATNILVSNSGVAKLVDFGLAAIDGEDGKGMKSQRTVDYSALERTCGSAKGDPRSDIFFMGCVFYNMLTGRVALEDSESKDPLKKMLKRSFGLIKPLSEHPYAPDPELSQIIERMMKMDLKARYQTMDAVATDLKSYRDTLQGKRPEVGQASPEDELERALRLDFSLFQNSLDDAEPEPPAIEEALGLDFSQFQRSPADAEPETETVLEPEPEPTVEPQPEVEVKAIAQKTILCVESQVEIQDALRKSLSRMGYRVLLVADAEVAAERYRETPSDALLFDIDGLGPGALNSLADMRARASKAKLPFRVLVLLGPRQAALKEKLPPADHMIVLSKPVKLKQVQDAIAELTPVA